MKEQVKELRVKIDGLYQLTKELKPFWNLSNDELRLLSVAKDFETKEIKNAAHSLIYAKAWLGKVLGELGTENPYKSGYKTVADIEPTADKATGGRDPYSQVIDWDSSNHIIRVDWLRTEIEKLVVEVKEIPTGETIRIIDVNEGLPETQRFNAFSREFAIARTNCYTHLSEARFALGFELERIKLENK